MPLLCLAMRYRASRWMWNAAMYEYCQSTRQLSNWNVQALMNDQLTICALRRRVMESRTSCLIRVSRRAPKLSTALEPADTSAVELTASRHSIKAQRPPHCARSQQEVAQCGNMSDRLIVTVTLLCQENGVGTKKEQMLQPPSQRRVRCAPRFARGPLKTLGNGLFEPWTMSAVRAGSNYAQSSDVCPFRGEEGGRSILL